jgi:hypothetical protein
MTCLTVERHAFQVTAEGTDVRLFGLLSGRLDRVVCHPTGARPVAGPPHAAGGRLERWACQGRQGVA